jgi:hypothetical protein
MSDQPDRRVSLTPGCKIYHLFNYSEVIVKGNKEVFLIKIEKIDNQRSHDFGPRAKRK